MCPIESCELQSWLAAAQAVPPVYLLCAACGLLAGFLAGLLGIGGALVVVPALYLLLPALGVRSENVAHVAVATSLAVMQPSAWMAAWSQHRHGALSLDWVARMAPGVLLGAALGGLLAQQLSGPALSLLFAAQSVYYGWGLVQHEAPAAASARARFARVACGLPTWAASPLTASFCACAGMGGGSLIVPYLHARGLPLLHAAATSSALNIGISLGGVLAFSLGDGAAAAAGSNMGTGSTVNWTVAAIVGGCAILAVPRGVAMAHRLPVATFRRALGAVTLLGAGVLIARTVVVSC